MSDQHWPNSIIEREWMAFTLAFAGLVGLRTLDQHLTNHWWLNGSDEQNEIGPTSVVNVRSCACCLVVVHKLPNFDASALTISFITIYRVLTQHHEAVIRFRILTPLTAIYLLIWHLTSRHNDLTCQHNFLINISPHNYLKSSFQTTILTRQM